MNIKIGLDVSTTDCVLLNMTNKNSVILSVVKIFNQLKFNKKQGHFPVFI